MSIYSFLILIPVKKFNICLISFKSDSYHNSNNFNEECEVMIIIKIIIIIIIIIMMHSVSII